MRQRHERLAVEAHLFCVAGGVYLREVAVGAETGIVDEHVDRLVQDGDLRCERRRLVDEIARDHVRVSLQARGELAHALLAPGHENHLVASL